MLLSLAAFLVVFGVVVLVHEWGHFMAARQAGVEVEEFGIGYPPRVKTLAVRNGVEYTLNAIPLGGFVRLKGEGDLEVEGGFASQGAWVRIRTLLAGPVMNLVLAAILLSLAYAVGDRVVVGRVVVESVAAGSPADQAGIRAGDIILAVGGREAKNTVELAEEASRLRGQETDVALQRGDERLTVRLTPRTSPPPGEGAMGVSIAMEEGYGWETVRRPLWEAVPLGLRQVWLVLGMTLSGFAQMLRVGIKPGDVAGPVGIFQMSGVVAQTGAANLLRFIAVLSVNLFIFNLLPLPPLDGGRIAFILLEKLRGGKRFEPQQEGLVNLVGLMLLLMLMLVFSYFDVQRLFGGAQSMP